MRLQDAIHKIEITSKGPEGVWYNSRIGQTLPAHYRQKVDNPRIRGYLINDCWFIPEQYCKRIIDKYKGNVHPVRVTDMETGIEQEFYTITEACKYYKISPSAFRWSLKNGKTALKRYLLSSNKQLRGH